jgi:hypothetical protein
MKLIIILLLLCSSAYCSDTITFPKNDYPRLYWSYSSDWDSDDNKTYWDKDDEYENRYGCPAVPEPSTYALIFGISVLFVAYYKKKVV